MYPREPHLEYCDHCDGCGWSEGDGIMQKDCDNCKGTGVVKKQWIDAVHCITVKENKW